MGHEWQCTAALNANKTHVWRFGTLDFTEGQRGRGKIQYGEENVIKTAGDRFTVQLSVRLHIV